jgi:ferrous iron transport protein B
MQCHSKSDDIDYAGETRIVLVGSPNVGKSLLFHNLTGKYATVSNYPGTTVDITKGRIKEFNAILIDTPGMYSLIAITEEERVARKILFGGVDVVVHVVDAKNIERMLPFTLQLIEAGFNTILVLNAMDDAERLGIEIDSKLLSERLGIPVIKTIATQKRGIDELKRAIKSLLQSRKNRKELINLNSNLGDRIKEISKMIEGEYPVSKKMIAFLLLAGDSDTIEMIRGERNYEKIMQIARSERTPYEVFMMVQRSADNLLDGVLIKKERKGDLTDKISDLSTHPLISIPMTLLSLYLLYLFAGVIGAQILVDSIESSYELYINKPLNSILDAYIDNYWIRELIGGEYGIVTLGLRYAIAIIFPIVTTFFIAFSILEDSGYLPRVATLLDTLFKKVGLSGRAVIPLLLGLGCGTMATIVTRTLENRKERLIATLMLAVGIPCSAQLGVMMGIAPDFQSLLIWILIIATVLIATGSVASKIIGGEEPLFFMELPPLRVPNLSNVLFKTLARLEWYFKEVLPIFILISLVIWIGRLTTLFDILIGALSIPSRAIGLPSEAGLIMLYGFFRRDYGAAGLFDLVEKGLFTAEQTVIAMVVLTLFVPCIAMFSVMCRERGVKASVAIFAISIAVAFGVGYLTSIAFHYI